MKQALQKRRCWLLPLVATLLWTACSGSGDDDAVQTPVPSGQQLTASYHITLLTANVLTSTDGVRSGNTWFFPVGREEKAVVYAKQDDRLTYIGQLTFKQDGLREYRIDSIDVQGESMIELPEGDAVSLDDITVLGDGKPVEVLDDGSFNSDANALIATGKNDRLLYINLVSTDNTQHQRPVELNATQTAVTMLLTMFPNVFEPTAADDFQQLKSLIATLAETQTLAAAIDRSIAAHGYFEVNDVTAEYRSAIGRIKQLLGLNANYLSKPATQTARRRTKPDYKGNSYRRMGFRIDVDQSSWDATHQMWNMEFTAYNERWGYTAVNVVDVMADGTQFPLYDGLEVLEYVVKPMSPKSFVGKFSSWEGLKAYFSDTWEFATNPDFHMDDMTFDMQQLSGIKLAFGMPTVQLQVVAPKDNGYLLTYTVVMNTTKPVLAFLGSTVAKVFEDYYMQEYIKNLLTPTMIEKTVRAMREGKEVDMTWVTEQILKELRRITLKIPADLPNIVSGVAVDDLGMALKDTMFFLKVIQETMDTMCGYAGLFVGESELIDLGLTFEDNNTGGTISDVPGSKF